MRQPGGRSLVILLSVVFALPALCAGPLSAQDSTHFSMEGVTVTAGAAAAASAHFELSVTVASLEPSGAASFCNAGFGVVLGGAPPSEAPPVPNHLIVLRNGANPAHVDLSWSGDSALYDVYRSQTASSLVSPGNYMTTSTGCLVVDTDPFVGPIVYYTVVPAGN
jgi:hypothetical protein